MESYINRGEFEKRFVNELGEVIRKVFQNIGRYNPSIILEETRRWYHGPAIKPGFVEKDRMNFTYFERCYRVTFFDKCSSSFFNI